MKRKYPEAMRAAARREIEREDEDDDAIEARDWYDEWTAPKQQDESDNNQRSQE